LQQVVDSVDTIFSHSEASARAAVAMIPDGTYEAESFLDDDGVDHGKKISIKVKVIVEGELMTIDLSNVSDQVKGFYNSGEAAGIACAQVAFKCLNAPLELPINDGCFRPLTVILPEGKVVNATRPAPMRWWMTFPMTVVDTVFKALSTAIPTQVIAGHHADLVVAAIHGRTRDTNALFLYFGGLLGGGWGAKHNEDGMCATIAINDGDTHNGPSEQVEARFPLLVEQYALRPDSGGAGRQRGGLGAIQTVRALSDIMLNTQIERVECRPWGLFGGLSAMGNAVELRRSNGDRVTFPSGKVFSQLLKAGDSWMLKSGGGGGFGSPLERDVSRVELDVVQGYISHDAAKDQYGVIVDRRTNKADKRATTALRAQMHSMDLPKNIEFTSRSADFDPTTLHKVRRLFKRDEESAKELYREALAQGLLHDRCCT